MPWTRWQPSRAGSRCPTRRALRTPPWTSTAALRRLVPDQQAALVLVDMLGYSIADAADVLGVSEGTVKSRAARGRARLLPRLAHLRPGAVPSQESGNRSAGPRVQPAQEGGDDALMNRHASDDELAGLGAGILQPRKAARIEQHLTGCAAVHAELSSQLASVPQLLSSVGFPAMPADLVSQDRHRAGRARSGSARPAPPQPRPAGGTCQSGRAAAVPAGTGAAGGCLASRSRATRVLAAAGALVIIGGGSYEHRGQCRPELGERVVVLRDLLQRARCAA